MSRNRAKVERQSLKLSFPLPLIERLEALQSDALLSSKSELLRNAFALYESVIREVRLKNGRLYAEIPDESAEGGKRTIEILVA